MKNNRLAVVAIMLLLAMMMVSCQQAKPSSAAQEALDTAGNLIATSGGSDEAVERATEVLSKALESEPNEASLLRSRANLLTSSGQYEAALADLNAAAVIEDLSAEVELGRCMLVERVHGRTEQARNCYSTVLKQYGTLPSSDTPTVNHVFAAIMAGHPRAEALRQDLLQGKGSKAANLSLPYAERDRYIKEMFP